jgi:hypothetical protein
MNVERGKFLKRGYFKNTLGYNRSEKKCNKVCKKLLLKTTIAIKMNLDYFCIGDGVRL